MNGVKNIMECLYFIIKFVKDFQGFKQIPFIIIGLYLFPQFHHLQVLNYDMMPPILWISIILVINVILNFIKRKWESAESKKLFEEKINSLDNYLCPLKPTEQYLLLYLNDSSSGGIAKIKQDFDVSRLLKYNVINRSVSDVWLTPLGEKFYLKVCENIKPSNKTEEENYFLWGFSHILNLQIPHPEGFDERRIYLIN